MGKSWLPAVCAIGVAFVAAGCTPKTADQSRPPSGSTVTTKQIVDTHPEVKKAMIDRLKAQIQASNLSPEEKQRQIDKLDQNGLPP